MESLTEIAVHGPEVSGEIDMLINSGYSMQAVAYYITKPSMGTILDADVVTRMKGSCGDTMELFLKVEAETIVDAKFQVMGCAGTVVSAMALADLVIGLTLAEALKIVAGDVFNKLGEIPAAKHHCISLSVKTLHQALKDRRVIGPIRNSIAFNPDNP
jgi:nitrogen fixation protein NifU and related proteins